MMHIRSPRYSAFWLFLCFLLGAAPLLAQAQMIPRPPQVDARSYLLPTAATFWWNTTPTRNCRPPA